VDRVLILLAVLAATVAFSAWWKARDGRVIGARATVTPSAPGSRWAGLPVEAADVVAHIKPSTTLALVEFTAPDCVPCVKTGLLLDEVAADRDDLSVHSVDVGDALDLVGAHRIMRAPTTLLVTEDGHLLGRVSGLPRRDELIALLDSTRQPQTT
jgi:thiol-disulfide isomerase/thioredoxin